MSKLVINAPATTQPDASTAKTVFVRLMFLRIGEIDTLTEKYQAQASVESRWPVELEELTGELSGEDQKRLSEGRSISLLKYGERHWLPQIYIENALGDLKEQIRYSAKISRDDNQVYVYEHRDIKGAFYEKLELHHFPSDVQDLSITVSTMFCNDRVILMPDPYCLSGVNREEFVDQQEWKLYAHVDAVQRCVDEFDYHSIELHEHRSDDNIRDRKRTVVTVTCHAARRWNYFFWNGYCLIFLITAISYACYIVPPHLLMHRLQTTCTLLLTSITFRWTVNKSLPTISYLTSMDAYAVVSIFSIVLNGIWHSFIGLLVFDYTSDNVARPGMWQTRLDRLAFCVSFGIFIVGNVLFVIWLLAVPLKVRREMRKKDGTFNLTKLGRLSRIETTKESKGNHACIYDRIPIS